MNIILFSYVIFFVCWATLNNHKMFIYFYREKKKNNNNILLNAISVVFGLKKIYCSCL